MTTQEIYDEALRNGCSPRLAEMLAHQQPPGTMGTDTAWIAGMHEDPHPGAPEKVKKWYLDRAKAAGVSTAGKTFISQLGAAENPEAWVSGLSDVKAVARKNNYGLTVNDSRVVEQTPLVAPKPVPLAEKTIKRFMAAELKENPKADQRLLREKIIDKHAPKWKE